MPTNILNLPDYRIVRVEENDNDYHITAEISNAPTVCMACGSERLIGHGRNEQVIRDIPTHGKRVAIYVDTRRWRCQDREPAGARLPKRPSSPLRRWPGASRPRRIATNATAGSGLSARCSSTART